jgi:hypothetical protein
MLPKWSTHLFIGTLVVLFGYIESSQSTTATPVPTTPPIMDFLDNEFLHFLCEILLLYLFSVALCTSFLKQILINTKCLKK